MINAKTSSEKKLKIHLAAQKTLPDKIFNY